MECIIIQFIPTSPNALAVDSNVIFNNTTLAGTNISSLWLDYQGRSITSTISIASDLLKCRIIM